MKNKRIIIALFGVTLSLMSFLSGCDIPNHYHPDTESRQTAPFTGVSLSGVGDVFISSGRPHQITVTADVDILDSIITDVNENGVLRIGESKQENGRLYLTCGNCPEPIDINVNAPELKGVAHAGRGTININANSPAGDIPDHLMILHTGNGDIEAQNYKAANATVVHTGSGSVKVWAADTLFISITAHDGEVLFKGDPVVKMFDHLKLIQYVDGTDIQWVLDAERINDMSSPSSAWVTSGSGKDPGIWLENDDERVRQLP